MELVIGVSFSFGHTHQKHITRSFYMFGSASQEHRFFNFTDSSFSAPGLLISNDYDNQKLLHDIHFPTLRTSNPVMPPTTNFAPLML